MLLLIIVNVDFLDKPSMRVRHHRNCTLTANLHVISLTPDNKFVDAFRNIIMYLFVLLALDLSFTFLHSKKVLSWYSYDDAIFLETTQEIKK